MKRRIFINFLLLPLIAFITACNVYGQKKKEIGYHKPLAKTITLTSSEFAQMGMIPLEYTGRGQNVSPSFSWSNLPKGTKSLVFLMTDYDGPAPWLRFSTVSHWIMYNIPPSYKGLEKGVATAELQKDGIQLAANYTKGIDYAGPKPPIGVHHYYFRVYALSEDLKLTNPTREQVMEAMKGKVLGYGEVIGRF